jgi:hypothetical protein
MRGHQPILLEEFKGLWARGDAESCPIEYFSDCENIQFIQSGFKSRDGISPFTQGIGNSNIVRIYTFVHNATQSILILDDLGNIYDTGAPSPTSPILTIPGMTDFAYYNFSGRAYISPNNGVTGLKDEFIYVYKGDGIPARKAGGAKPTGAAMGYSSGGIGSVESGYHIFAVVYETDTGFLTAPGPDVFTEFNVPASGLTVVLSGVPVSPDGFVIARHILATKAINPLLYTGNKNGYEFFIVPDGKINNNTATTATVSFYDAELLESADRLFDLYEHPPAGVTLNLYHNRLVSVGEYGEFNSDPTLNTINNPSIARVSNAGEPEAFDQIDGLIISPLDGNPLTNCQEYRDILYLFKKDRTYAYSDSGDSPSSWPLTIIDQGIGASIHGIATVLDSGGINIEYLIIIDFSGVMLFNGTYPRPELSWVIKDFWFELDKADFKSIQIVNDTINQVLYITLPNQRMLIGDYSMELSPTSIRWAPWRFVNKTNTITLFDTNTLVIGSSAIHL